MTRFLYTLSAMAVCAASPALSQTSAAELWEEWQAQGEARGQTVTATATPSDTGLTLSGFTTSVQNTDLETSTMIDEVVLTETADGSVLVTMSDTFTIMVSFQDTPGAPMSNIEILGGQEGLEMTVSGTAEARSYAYNVDTVTLTEGVLSGGRSAPPELNLDVTMSDIDASYAISGADPATQTFTSEGSLGGMSFSMELTDPEDETAELKAGLLLGAISSSSAGTFASLGSFDPVTDTIPENFLLAGELSYASIEGELAFNVDGDQFAGTYANTGGRMVVDISPEAIGYDIAATGMRTRVSGSEIPLPIDVSAASTEFALNMPLAASDTPQDMNLRIGINDFMVSEQLLAMVDPSQAVPRDPANFLLDMTGQVQLFVDLMAIDPEQVTGPPGEIRAVTVNELQLAVGGAELTGTADLTFAPGQIVPMPMGQADLQLSGGNTLMTSLMGAGLVPPQAGAMVMGMTGVFARPGAGPDTLETTIEFGPNGSITANGIPLQ